jgi:hypothetical protein
MTPLLLALASAAPGPLPIQGSLLGADGAPLTGTHAVAFMLYADASDTSADQTVNRSVSFDAGTFAADIGEFDLDWFAANTGAEIALSVDGGPASDRVAIGWAPLAAFASTAAESGHASTATTADQLGGTPATAWALESEVGALAKAAAYDTVTELTDALASFFATFDADTVDGIHASTTPTAGKLLPLNGSGKLPGSVLDTTGAPFALADHSHGAPSELFLRGTELSGSGSTLTGMVVSGGALVIDGSGYGGGSVDLEVTAANSPYVLPEGVNEFRNVTVRSGGTLTAAAWNGSSGGRVQIRATGSVIVESGGTIDLKGKGFRGGMAVGPQSNNQWLPVGQSPGEPGESHTGVGSVRMILTANGGGGSGGAVDNCSYGAGGGGGAYGMAGTVGKGGIDYSATCGEGVRGQPWAYSAVVGASPGPAGAVYGDAAITTLHLGSGGGAAGSDHDCFRARGGHGGNGGGAVLIEAASVTIGGTINVEGNGGGSKFWSGAECGDNGGGGGGAGGSIKVRARTVTVAAGGRLTARGGAAGSGNSGTNQLPGGVGGDGRIRIETTTLSNSGTLDVNAAALSTVQASNAGTGDGTVGTWTSPVLTFTGAGRFRQVDLLARRGEGTWLYAELCPATTASGTDTATCLPIAPSGAVDAPSGANFARVKLSVVDRASPKRFSMPSIRVEYGP